MAFCRIDENGIVFEVIHFDPEGRFHPSIAWHACPDDTRQGAKVDEETGAVTDNPPPPPPVVPPPPSADQVAELLAYTRNEAFNNLAAIRWQHEEAGTTLPDGTPIPTDRVTQGKITAAYVKAQSNSDYIIEDWKITNGVFRNLDATTIALIADTIEDHVQACFSREARLTEQLLAADTVEKVRAIDLNAGWP